MERFGLVGTWVLMPQIVSFCLLCKQTVLIEPSIVGLIPHVSFLILL